MDSIFNKMRERRLNEEAETEVKDAPVVETPEVEAPEVAETPVVETPEVEAPAADVSEEEMNEAVKKVVRDGKVETKNVSTHKKRLTSAQKKALAQARKKAHTAGANKARAKSMKKRASMNMEDIIVCPECGFEGDAAEFDEEDGVLFCPECGAEYSAASEGCKKNEEVDMVELAVRLDECNASDYMKKALNEGRIELVKKYLDIKEGE